MMTHRRSHQRMMTHRRSHQRMMTHRRSHQRMTSVESSEEGCSGAWRLGGASGSRCTAHEDRGRGGGGTGATGGRGAHAAALDAAACTREAPSSAPLAGRPEPPAVGAAASWLKSTARAEDADSPAHGASAGFELAAEAVAVGHAERRAITPGTGAPTAAAETGGRDATAVAEGHTVAATTGDRAAAAAERAAAATSGDQDGAAAAAATTGGHAAAAWEEAATPETGVHAAK